MCGRVHLTHSAEEIAEFFDLPPAQIDFDTHRSLDTPRYNVAPGARLPVLRMGETGREGAMLRWGLVPSWAKDEKIGYRMINARSETAAEKPSFRRAWQSRRCAVAASGYYEWWRRKPKARPERAFRFHPVDEPMFAFAGLWERWVDPDGEPLETCTILTTDAAESLEAIHDRMPVMLSADTLPAWIAPGAPPPLDVIAPPGQTGVHVAVSEVDTVVNDARNDDPMCLVEHPPGSLAQRLMKHRGWAAGWERGAFGPQPRWVDPESGRPAELDASDPALAHTLLAEMDAAEVDITAIASLPPNEVVEAWLTWQS